MCQRLYLHAYFSMYFKWKQDHASDVAAVYTAHHQDFCVQKYNSGLTKGLSCFFNSKSGRFDTAVTWRFFPF